eukprot:TRINITY_DN1346_c3_g1_i1.p1 TRINITY_DN1346_c3_g1~~TRINITY_DN1346_c3_g1_i1.p1  ORF type:complete len:1051 (+),score=491.67 TRINITY_DN1346_c3_g1_i1:72-3155(+)
MGADEGDRQEELPVPPYMSMIMDYNVEQLHGFGGLQGIAAEMSTDLEDGIRSQTVDDRKKKYGENQLPEEDDVTLMDKVMEQFEDPMIKLLIVAALVSLALHFGVPNAEPGGWIEGVAILVSVAIVAVVSSLNEYEKEMKFKELSASRPVEEFIVKRDGENVKVPNAEIVQGDVLFLKAGDTAPVDAVYIEGQDVKMDESSVTGENIEIVKCTTGKGQFITSGASMLEGECSVLVTGVGVNCLAGRAEMKNREKKDATPLQTKLEGLTEQITTMGIGMAVLTSLAIFGKSVYMKHLEGDDVVAWFQNDLVDVARVLINSLTVGITIIVVAVPEGLPLSVTIALAYSMKKMLDDQNLVRHLAACETMGGATQICSDKTGTLTQNKMTVVRVMCPGERAPHKIPVRDHVNYHQDVTKLRESLGSDYFSILTEGLIMNSTAAKDESNVFKGNKTECAMLDFVEGMDQDIRAVRQRLRYEKTKTSYDRHTYPFSSATKRMTTLLRKGADMHLHVKGASELVLLDCDKQLLPDGRVEKMSDGVRANISDTISDMARQALRTLMIAYAERPGRGHDKFDEKAPMEEKLTFVAILAIEDPMRPEVPQAVAQCKQAGITVRMVTGDNKATAIAIAKQAGIYTPLTDDIAMEGQYFRQLDGNEEKMTYVLKKLKVLARMTPLDKQILVQALRQRGEVVAVTGDGTNDAPALKLANVGFAMMTGTEVAKGASDIILMDDNFASVVTAAMWGRNINDNIRKFIQFQSTVNVAAVLIAFIGSVISAHGESPLKPVQLLWLNLIMDSLAALALATEAPTKELLHRPPNFAENPLISRRMWCNILGQAAYQIALQLWLINVGFEFFGVQKDDDQHMTIIFNVFVLMQVVNEFNARKLRNEVNLFAGLTRAPLFLAIIVITCIIQVAAVQYMGGFMGCVPITADHWIKCLQVSIIPLPIGIVLRMIPISEPEPPKPKVPEYVETFAREKRLYDPTKAKAGRHAFRGAAREVIQQVKISAAISTLTRAKRGRTTSMHGFKVNR